MDVLEFVRKYGQRPAEEHSPGQVHEDFDQVAENVPRSSLAQGLAAAFRSNRTPPFSQMIGHLFRSSNGEQRAGVLLELFQAAPGDLASEVPGVAAARGKITPQQAQQVPPETVERLAAQAEKKDPSVIDRMSMFYAEHPALAKMLGVTALGIIMSKAGETLQGRGAG